MKYTIKNADGTYEGPGSGVVARLEDATLYDYEPEIAPGQKIVKVEVERVRVIVPLKDEPYRVEKRSHGPPLYGANFVWSITGRDQSNQPAVIAYCDDQVLATRLARLANISIERGET